MHISVFLQEAIDCLNIKSDGKYVDATVGYAGHSSKILERLDKKGFLFAFDQDENAVKYSQDRLSKISDNFKIFNTNFKNLKGYLSQQVDGFLFDLGVSSPQLDDADRGFSYNKSAPLDMRMDKRQKLTAYDVVNTYDYNKLLNILYVYGEEKYAKSIAKNIINNRPINDTITLSEIIKDSVPFSYKKDGHPARKTFQAIRIEVNNELDIIKNSLLDAFDLLNKNGTIVVITFHSLEDRIVKNTFKLLTSSQSLNGIPYDTSTAKAELVNKKPLVPSEEMIKENPRCRSAKLRCIKKL